MCDCMEKVDGYLKDRNTQLSPTIAIDIDAGTLKFKGLRLETLKIDSKKRGKPISVTASYCPFCGQKYEEDNESPADQT